MEPICQIEVPEVPRFSTTDANVCREYIRDNTKTHNFRVIQTSRFLKLLHHECMVNRISVNWCNITSTAGFNIAKISVAPYYSFNFVLNGECHLEGAFGSASLRPGGVFVLDPDRPTHETWSEDCQLFTVRVDRQLIEQAIAEELAWKPIRHVAFDPVGRDPGIVSWLSNITRGVWLGGDEAALIKQPRVAHSIEHTLVTMLLSGLHHSESDDLNRQGQGAAPYYIKRAEALIHEHARDDLTVDEICEKTGISARSLFYGFKRWRNTTPMAYVRDVRLDLARKELQKARTHGGTVSEAAVNAGFTNFSQFSKIYKARFGETPSVTLRGS